MNPGGHPVALVVRLAVGAGLVVAGWLGASDEVALDRQAPWIAVAIAGALVASASGALWLLGARRAVLTRATGLLAAVEALPEPAAAATDDGVRLRRRTGAPRTYHRPGCPLVVGRAVEAGDPARWRAHGTEPCAVCGA